LARDRPTNRWTCPLHEAALAVANDGLITRRTAFAVSSMILLCLWYFVNIPSKIMMRSLSGTVSISHKKHKETCSLALFSFTVLSYSSYLHTICVLLFNLYRMVKYVVLASFYICNGFVLFCCTSYFLNPYNRQNRQVCSASHYKLIVDNSLHQYF